MRCGNSGCIRQFLRALATATSQNSKISAETFSDAKGRKAKERDHDLTLLGQFVHDFGDLLAKSFCAAGGRMTDAVRIDPEALQLSGGDFSQRDDLIARK